MNVQFDEGVEDVEAAVSSGRPLRDHGPYGIKVGDENLDYRPLVIQEAEPTGKQILEAAGKQPPIEYALFRVLADGLLEDVRVEETTDLRTHGAEKFLAFRSSTIYRFELNGRSFEWGAARISGRTLKKLAEVEVATHDVFQLEHHGERLVDDKELVDLSKPGLERFVTRAIAITIFVNTRERHVHQRRLSYWEVVRLAFPEAVPDPKVLYTVTYSQGPHQNPAGNLQDKQSVFITDRMVFDVTPTDQS